MKLNMTKETREGVLELCARGLDRNIVTVVPDSTSAETRSLLEAGLARAAEGRSVTAEDIAKYNDACNRKYLAKMAPECRYNPGDQTSDPTASLREKSDDDDDEFDPESVDDRAGHLRAAQHYRNCASKAKTMDQCVQCHKDADRHLQLADVS